MNSAGRIAGGHFVAGAAGCFSGQTLVRVPDGKRRIDELKQGDLVLSFDDRGQIHEAQILKVHVHENEAIVRYLIWGNKVLDATPNHWVLNQFNAFVEIGTLGPDDCLVDESGHLRPIVSRHAIGNDTVYNLTVEGHHTFIAGGIRVHNAGLGLSGAGGDSGGKGGGGTVHTPTEAGDNLDSTQYANIIDLLSEGEIEGLKNGHKSIFVDNTPLQNDDNSYNFKNVTIHTRNGTQDQSYIPIATDIEDEKSVGIVIDNASPIVRSITDSNVNAVRVTINVPQLQVYTDQGDIVGTSVRLQIAVQYNGGGFTTSIDDTISGRTGDAYQRDYLVNINGSFPVDVKVIRVTANSTSSKVINSFSWQSYTEIIFTRMRYPNSALVGMRIDAEQFNAIPRRSYLIRGIKIRIPTNATVDSATGALIYSGTWNGTFSAAQWCSDPAWILWDLLTSTRYGFGDHILTDAEKSAFTGNASKLDKWAFYSASQYCSATNTYLTDGSGRTGATDDYNKTTGCHGVPDGFGGYEPRFSCNISIQTAEEAYKLINDMSSVFRAMPYWSAGAATVTQDKPADSSYLFTLANVSEDGFSYSGSSLKARPNVAVVSYLDLELRDIAYEAVEDRESISKYGAVRSEISAFACTSRGQAHRIGEWLLYSEKEEGEVISFTASIDAGVVVRPGQIIDVADPVKAGQRRGGRIQSATASSVTIDDTTGITAGSNQMLSVILPSGSVETRSVSSISGSVVTLSSAFNQTPNLNSIWIYQTDDLQTSKWRVLSVTEQDQTKYAIAAISYNSSKYAYIEQDRPLQQRDITNLNLLPLAPTNLSVTETLFEYQGQVRAKVIATWKPVVGVNQYRVRWRKDDGNWTTLVVNGPDVEVLDITPGLFEFEIYSLSPSLKLSTSSLAGSISALGKTAPPTDVSNLNFSVDKDLGMLLTWDSVPDMDLDQYEIRRGASWGSSQFITQVKATTYKISYLDDGTYVYFVKSVDTSGIYSTNSAQVAVTIAGPNPTTISSTIQGSDLVLSWTVPTVTTYAIAYYRVTYGNTYSTSAELAKTQSTTFTVPVTWTGLRTFWVAPVDAVDRFANPPGSAAITIASATAPAITTSVGGNTATLSWTPVSGTLPTAGYEIRQGTTFSTATVLASITGTSYTFKATWSGAQTFWVVARDANGSYGTQASATITVNAAGAPTLSSSFAGQNIIFNWSAIKGTLDTDFYLLKRGASWAAGTTVATIYSTAYTLKADWSGVATFWLAAVDINGTEGTPVSLASTVIVPGAPTMTQQVVDNNVLLRWNDVTQTLPIASYELRKGASWASAAVIGTKQGNFTSVFETSQGSYVYWIAGIDSAGNYGTPSSVTAVVNQPPDYFLQFNQNSTWTGTKTNIYSDLLLGQIVNVNTTETWQSHFTSRGYTSPQDQINAGFAYYLMPSTTTAAYEEDFDYGTVLAGTKITATLTSSNFVGSTIATPTISVRKLLTDPWTTYPGLSEAFVTDFRYFRIRYDFASTGNNDLMLLASLNIRLDSKLRNDAGSGTANSADSGGTTVMFNIAFVDIQSISVTPSATSSVIAVYDFVDVPNPTSFKVLLFNSSGTRVSGNFSWSARGV